MDSLYSKAFWLGRNLNIIGYVKGVRKDVPDDDNMLTLKHTVQGFCKSLNIHVDDIPGWTSSENIGRLREAVRLDLQVVQSQFVARCFAFGFDFTSWWNFRGGYGEDGKKNSDLDLDKVEANLRKDAIDIGLGPQWEQSLAAAKDPALSTEAFKDKIGLDMVLAMEAKLDAVDPAQVRSKSTASKRLFIVMPMMENDPALEDVLMTIQNTATGLGLEANRVDQLEDSGRITDSIVDGLKRSTYVVVDLTHARPNVYWEAGFTHGLGKIPIYIARKGTNLEFDVKDYPVIYFANNKNLGERLAQRLQQLMQATG